ncbi:glycoside hydrolase family 3 protein [Arthrobacter sp. HY1533]|uniref:glycoside hydrolase family 3 protein n=1 Tax=Arthrobacter sp. HY1533 TaxID=2970919 RepID=UPI0022B9FB64|nr:glycoside hydrolase family 3 N-terminal domain-containing protein [Arthrobacter sp. HY1533]
MKAIYLNPDRPVQERVADLLGRMTLAEKAGLMFHSISMVQPGEESADLVDHGTEALITQGFLSHFNVHQLPSARLAARWHNRMQELAASTRLGIPVTVSTDPRHASAENMGASFAAGFFSAWPEAIGFAALGDEETVRGFADIARQEYLAVGIRAALHPSIDLATEPRWARQYGGFGQDAETSARLAVAYLEGFQGKTVGPSSVACMTKHFPGGGPQRDGEDPHFPYGREQVYPGENFDYHLYPFRATLAAGTSAVMPYYGMPVGLKRRGEAVEEVGFGFNRQIITGLLRKELGYDGVVCTDWGLLNDSTIYGKFLPARAWGVEHLSMEDRMIKVVDAGCDQFGGEECPEALVRLVAEGKISESRIDESVTRLLRVKFELGLFENPFVDEDAAVSIAGNPLFQEAGLQAQARSVVVLKAPSQDLLPLDPDMRVFVENMDGQSLVGSAQLVSEPSAADLAIVRLNAPFTPRDELFLEAAFHAGSLDFADDVISRITELASQTKVVLVVNLDRPAVLTPIEPLCEAILGVFGVSDAALARVLSGHTRPEGTLPFELPSSMDAVLASRTDVPSDTANPLYAYGHSQPLGKG